MGLLPLLCTSIPVPLLLQVAGRGACWWWRHSARAGAWAVQVWERRPGARQDADWVETQASAPARVYEHRELSVALMPLLYTNIPVPLLQQVAVRGAGW